MKKEIAEKWVRLLRSGDFQQTYGRLRRDQEFEAVVSASNEPRGHCCLGVLCELAKGEGAIEGYVGSEIFLPMDVAAWAGTNGYNPALLFPVEESAWAGVEGELQLAELNDSKEWDFGRIADLIEERWEEI